MITLKRTTSEDFDFQNLVVFLDQDLKFRDGDEHAFFAQFNKIDTIRNVVVCYMDNKPIGCGAFKEFDEKTVEIKRMFVQPDHRGKGIASSVLIELELWAAELLYSECVLETGKKQFEAVKLYHKLDYTTIPNYRQYENVESSICMKKIICVNGRHAI